MPTAPPRFSIGPKREAKAWATSARTTTQRGYGWDHQKARAELLQREPLCRACAKYGRVTLATIADHIRPLAEGGSKSIDNLAPTCGPCHKAKTLREALRGKQGPR